MPSSAELPAELARLVTVRDWIRWGASQFQAAGLVYGHGTDNAMDEAFHLVLHALHLPYELPALYLEAHLDDNERAEVHALLRQRIDTRQPAAYLIGEMQFCGVAFHVDSRVLIPRSPIAELIERGFAPWLEAPPAQVLDLCAGSGCIGIACALHFDCEVDLGEIDAGALEVCERNILRHGVQDRVRAVQSDLFGALRDRRYDLIVSNPPYVATAEWQALAPEYQSEPRLALDAGVDGMDLVARILRAAPDHLHPQGALICEVGGSQEAFEARWPRLPVIWIEFERGGDGVFFIGRQALLAARDSL
ncbi:50S ribosomal protein L3 N(5)-glutamine methyltransferase [Panacagrimonas sp.]|uniref:50S ribosomal protein L3 N(5)-glutamine methyltransferase n=1 Tax=Panacagrimonas sp. TaxID=2480088 RepID=UPI003B51AD93